MTKLLENIYRCVNIALVNELKLLYDRMGIDIFEVINAPKPSHSASRPSILARGSADIAFPSIRFYLSWRAKQFDFRARFIELAGEVNTAIPYYVVEKAQEPLNQHRKALWGSRVLILGVAYKKDIDDLRESHALTIMELLRQRGAEVWYNDP